MLTPYRLLVAGQLQRLCHSLVSAEAWGNKNCNETAVFDYVRD